jgi:hypothetical protein
MSTTFNVVTVANSIESLSISGVTVADVDEITSSIGDGISILVPSPDNFITGLTITAAEVSAQNLDVNYDLNYTYYHCAIGGDLLDVYSAMLAKIALIIKALSQNETLTGAMDNGFPTISHIGPVQDPSGNVYHGCDISIHIMQFLEV